MTVPRSQIVDLAQTRYYHCTSRCVRQAHLCGEGFEHRMQWIEDRIELLAANFAVSICSFSVLENHLHVLVRLDPESIDGWTDEEVVRRWLNVYHPKTLNFDNSDTLQCYVNRLVSDKAKVTKYRDRLVALPWFMKSLKEPIARRANKEENITGTFWDGRYKSVGIYSEEALLSTCAYIDLNPVAAGISYEPLTSEHTSLRQRVEHVEENGDLEDLKAAADGSVAGSLAAADIEQSHWLCPFDDRQALLAEVDLGVGTKSREGMLPGFSLGSYLQLVDYTSRLCREGKASLPQEAPAIFERLSTTPEAWNARMQKLFDMKKQVGHVFTTDPEDLREIAAKRGVRHVTNLIA